jgi:hypothetical protein
MTITADEVRKKVMAEAARIAAGLVETIDTELDKQFTGDPGLPTATIEIPDRWSRGGPIYREIKRIY